MLNSTRELKSQRLAEFCEVCKKSINQPTQPEADRVRYAHVVRDEFFSAKTARERNSKLMEWATLTGMFSNMSDDEIERYIEISTQYALVPD